MKPIRSIKTRAELERKIEKIKDTRNLLVCLAFVLVLFLILLAQQSYAVRENLTIDTSREQFVFSGCESRGINGNYFCEKINEIYSEKLNETCRWWK